MLAEFVHHVIGVDPDRDWITLAVVDAHTTGITAHDRFPATAAGYAHAVEFVDAYSVDTERAWAVEGTASFGRGLTVALARRGEWVIEFDRPSRQSDGACCRQHDRSASLGGQSAALATVVACDVATRSAPEAAGVAIRRER